MLVIAHYCKRLITSLHALPLLLLLLLPLLPLLRYCFCSNYSIISMEKGGNCKSVFTRFCDISAALKKSAEADGTKLMYSEKLGYLGTCASNIGTGLRYVQRNCTHSCRDVFVMSWSFH
jgi:ATP:guanido phosphotransferase, C-terminal catalytic domain